ncbi:unnamed protein product [Rhodiola kirilowii]
MYLLRHECILMSALINDGKGADVYRLLEFIIERGVEAR